MKSFVLAAILQFMVRVVCGQLLSEDYQSTISKTRYKNIDELIAQIEIRAETNENSLLLAELYFLKGRNDLALKFLKELEGEEEIKGHPQPELYTRWLKNYGLLLWNQGKTDQALEFLQQSLVLYQSSRELKKENTADLLNNIGLVYVKSLPKIAVDYYAQALDIYASLSDVNLDKIIQLSVNISLAEIEQGNYINSLKVLNNALDQWESGHQKGLPTEGFIKANIGGVYMHQSQLVLAEEYLNEAKAIYIKNYGERNSELANIYGQLAEIELKRKSYEKSLFYIQKAFIANSFNFEQLDVSSNPELSDVNKFNIQLTLLMRKSVVLESYYYGYSLKSSHLKLSLAAIDHAEDILQAIRVETVNKRDLIELSDLGSELYEDGQRIALQLHEVTLFGNEYIRKAFQYAEQSKSSLLKTAVFESNAERFSGIPQEVLEREKEYTTNLAYLNSKVALESEASVLIALRARYFELKQEYEKYITELESRYPEYYKLKYKVPKVNINQIQQSLRKHEAIIEYSLALKSNEIYIYMIKKDHISFHIAYDANDILKYLKAYRNTLLYKLNESFAFVSSKLFKDLLPFKVSKQISTLIIVPDGELSTVPFEAFIKRDKIRNSQEYLIELFDVSYSYAASLYKGGNIEEHEYGSNALLIAPVEFGDRLQALPSTEQEGRFFKSWCEKRKILVTSKIKAGATKQWFKDSPLNTYRFIHLATHGKVDLTSPDLSGVYFANTSLNSDVLYVGEIYGLSLSADLVVLSACETGLGEITRGEGVMGLGQAFAYAGANNLMLSLWKVQDKSTSILMKNFYKEELVKESSTFSEGLRLAKLAMIHSAYSAPYYWAPFILWSK